MKRLFLVVMLCLAATWVSASEYSPSGRPERQYYVIASDAPASARRGGPGVRLADGTADDVDIQAMIDLAQAEGTAGFAAPDVFLVGGTFNITNTIYIGYDATYTTPNSTYGVNLRGLGCVPQILWAGSSQWRADGSRSGVGKWMIQFAPKSYQVQPFIEKIQLAGATSAATGAIAGIYCAGVTNGGIRDVSITNCTGLALFADRCWGYAEFRRIHITSGDGMSALFYLCNASTVDQLFVFQQYSISLIPDIYFMYHDASSGSLTPLETVTGDTETATVLCQQGGAGASGYVVLANIDLGDYPEDEETLTGGTSGSTIAIETSIAKKDLRSNVCFLDCNNMRIGSVYFEDVMEYNAALSADYPLVLLDQCENCPVDRIYAEGGGSTSGEKQLSHTTLFKLNDCDQCALRDLWVQPELLYAILDSSVAVDADVPSDGTSTISGVSASLVSGLAEGDSVYLWDGAGGITDGTYTVEAGASGTSFGVSDLEETDADCRCYAITSANRETPQDCISLVNSRQCRVENATVIGVSSSIVSIDSNCQDTFLSGIVDHKTSELANENLWMSRQHPRDGWVGNAGVRTVWVDPRFEDYSSYYQGASAPPAIAGKNIDGVIVASASALPIGTAFGPLYKVYVSGTTAVTSITGGYLNQIITLIATDASGFTVTDGAALDVGTGNVALAQYETITLICNAAAGNSWRVMGIEAYP